MKVLIKNKSGEVVNELTPFQWIELHKEEHTIIEEQDDCFNLSGSISEWNLNQQCKQSGFIAEIDENI